MKRSERKLFRNGILSGGGSRSVDRNYRYLDLNGLCRLLGSTETILPYARIYAFYILVSAPAMASSCVMNNVLRYEGYANLAMVGLVSGGILNMAGDAILMWGLNLGIRGAALSTMISQYISLESCYAFPAWKDSEQPDTEIFYLGICGT